MTRSLAAALFAFVILAVANVAARDELAPDKETPRSLADLKKKLLEIQRPPKAAEDQASAARSAALRRLQAYRYLAGVPYEDVALDDDMNKLAEAAAKICAKLNRLDHNPKNPGLPDEEYELAKKGTGSSNLAQGPPTLQAAVDGWMDDSDAGNIDRLGHRRWCLNPAMLKTGFGQSGKFYAMNCFDRSRKDKFTYDYICWPPRGLAPVEYFSANQAWSVSLNPGKYVLPKKDAAITVQEVDAKDKPVGQPLALNYQNVNGDGFGSNLCVIFRPAKLVVKPGKRYRAEINDLKDRQGKDAEPIRFLVEFVSVK